MALREILAHFGVDVDTEELEQANKSIDGFIEKIKSVGTALVGGEFAKQIFEFGAHIAEQGDQLEKASIRLGISTDSLQALGYAAVQSGSDVGTLTFALLTLQDKIGDALINPFGEGEKALKKYGIEIRDSKGKMKDATDVFKSVADKIADTKDESKKAAIAMGVFGRSGRALLPLLKNGSDGLGELTEEFERLGGGIRENAIKASADYVTQMGKLSVVHAGLTGQIGVVLLPVLGRFIDWIIKLERAMIDVTATSSTVQTVLGALGVALTVLAVKSAIAFAPWIAWAALLGGLFLIIEDIVTMFRGGDSAMGRFIDKIFGKDAHTEAIIAVAGAWKAIGDALKNAGPYIKDAIEFLKMAEGNAEKYGGGLLGDAMFNLEQLRHGRGTGYKGQNGAGENDSDDLINRDKYNLATIMKDAREYNKLNTRDRAKYVPGEIPNEFVNNKDAFTAAVVAMAGKINSVGGVVSIPFVGADGTRVIHQKNSFHIHDATDPHKVAKVVDERIKERAAHAAQVLHKKAESK